MICITRERGTASVGARHVRCFAHAFRGNAGLQILYILPAFSPARQTFCPRLPADTQKAA